MSDSEEDEKGGTGLAGFLFGNVDAGTGLDADYLDPEIREHLGALEDSRLGLGEHLQDLGDGRAGGRTPGAGKRPASAAGAGGEVAKAQGALNFYDEEELVDYTPAAADSRPAPARAPQQPAAAPQPPARPARAPAQLKLPVLASDGRTTFLRFSQLFAEAPPPQRLHSRQPPARQPEACEDGSDEEQLLRVALALPAPADSDAESSGGEQEAAEPRVPDDAAAAAAAEAGPASEQQAAQQGQAAAAQPPAAKRRKERRATGGLGAGGGALQQLGLPQALQEPVQLAEWEAGIDWGESSGEAPQPTPEEDSDAGGAMETESDAAGKAASERRDSDSRASTSYAAPQAVPWEDGGAWEADIQWDSDAEAPPPQQRAAPDLNDPHLIFRLAGAAEGEGAELLQRAAAIVLPPLPQVRHGGAPPLGKGRLLELLARANVSQDEDYVRRKPRRGALLTGKHRHSVPAMQLATLPPKLLDLREYHHRPRGAWVPPASKPRAKAREGEKSSVRVVSLVGPPKLAAARLFKGVDLAATSLATLWDVVKAGAKFADCGGLPPPQRALWCRGAQPRPLLLDVPIAQSGASPDANMELCLVVSGCRPVPSAKALAIPDALAGTPVPVAFQKPKQLTADDGHLLLLEYAEEQPLLLSRPGMCVRAVTYYRRADDSDTGHHDLLQEERWRTGAIEPLAPGEDSPFYLGDVRPGARQLAVESNMTRSPAAPHALPASDFLLVRHASGALSLRELAGGLTAGQQEPLRRVPAPNSKEAKDTEEARMVVHVLRELRRQKARQEKRKQAGEATVTVRELADLFPDLSEGVIRSRLRDRCSCVPFKDDAAGTWRLADGVTIADERELRQLCRPEDWCAVEAMTAGQLRLAAAGIARGDKLAALPLERLRLALEQLSPPEAYAAAAAELELAVQTTPWALTDSFVSAMRDGKGFLALAGQGDPTARGEGFSYIREATKTAAERQADLPPTTAREGSITGTNKDLRRLTMAESKAILMKLGLSEEDIKGLGRWQRIAAVRDLSTAVVGEEEGELGVLGNRYARVARASAEEQARQKRLQAQQIFDRQAAALVRVEEVEDEGEEESWADELEKELETEEAESQPSGSRKGGARREEEEEEEELEEVEELRKAGFLKGEGALARGRKLEAKPGERRIRRTITFPDAAGNPATRVLIYSERDKVAALNDLYRTERDAGSGFGRRTVSGAGVLTTGDGDEWDAPAAPRRNKKNMAKVQCKACGQMGHYRSNKLCPMYEQTHAKKKEKAAAAAAAPPEEALRVTLPSLGGPTKRPQAGEEPPAKRARGEQSARQRLGSEVLCAAIAAARQALPEAVWAPFQTAVARASAPDYTQFVPAGEEMHLEKMEGAARAGRYASGGQLLADFARIVSNAAAYNAPGAGQYGGPEIVAWAEQLAAAAEAALRDPALAPALAEAEAAVQAEDAAAAAAAAEQPSASAEEPPAEAAAADGGKAGGSGGGGSGGGALEQWVQCSKCQKWRRISQKVAEETVASAADAPWFCEWDYERQGASCELPDDSELEHAGA